MLGLIRICTAGRLLGRAAIVVAIIMMAGEPGHAEDTAKPTTIVVFGDSQAAGLARGLQRVLVENSRYRVLNRTHAGAALVHGAREWLGPIERFTAHEKADIAVVMFGANDRLDMDDDGTYLHFRTEAWRKVYAARIDRILEPLAKAGLKILWCGNPIARSAVYTKDMAYINSIYAAEVARFGGHFVPLWDIVADAHGDYTAFGKDRYGETERLRADDGIHFSAAGYEMIAEKIIGLLPSAMMSTAAKAPTAPAPSPTAIPVRAVAPPTAPVPAIGPGTTSFTAPVPAVDPLATRSATPVPAVGPGTASAAAPVAAGAH